MVTGAPRTSRPARRTDGRTGAGPDDEHVRALVRAQLRTSLLAAGTLAATLGSLPLLLALVPAAARASVAGIAPAWPLLGVLAYPLLYGIGRWYVARAEATETACGGHPAGDDDGRHARHPARPQDRDRRSGATTGAPE